jgi:hypothetical protein
MDYISLITALLAFVVLPSTYLALCVWMFCKKAWWFTFGAYFYVFGAFGGWCLMIVAAFMGPGIGAVSAIGMEMFLLTAAMVMCLVCSLVLQFKKQKDSFDLGAMWGGYAYIVLHGSWMTFMIFSPVIGRHS